MPTYIIYYNQGNSSGPFDVYLSGSSGLTLYASNIAQWQLVNGYLVTFPDGIPSSSIDIFDTSYGCFNEQNIPFPSVSPSVTPSLSITPTVTPSISVSPTVTPTVTRTPSVTPSITPPPSITRTPSVTPSISRSPGASSTPTPTPSITRTPSATTPPTYTAYIMTAGYSQAYLACYDFNQGGGLTSPNIWITDPVIAIGTRVYSLSGGVYTPIVGNNLWYAIASWFPVSSRACQIDNSGYITDIALTNNCT
jgi:hypothetical protein